jgi:hypothetical protein
MRIAVVLLLAVPGVAAAQQAPANSTFLLTTPTAWTLPKETGYASFHEIVAATVQVGATDSFSLGAGTPIPLLGRVVWLMPKYQLFRGESSAAAVGVFHGQSLAGDGHLGFGYFVASKATEAGGAVTAGLGWGYGQDAGSPFLILGGETAQTGRVRWLADAYIGREFRVASVGARLIGRRVDWEFGALVPFFGRVFAVAPMVNIIYKFGN